MERASPLLVGGEAMACGLTRPCLNLCRVNARSPATGWRMVDFSDLSHPGHRGPDQHTIRRCRRRYLVCPIGGQMATPEGLDVNALAPDIIDAHGSGAAELARENPRTAILSGRIAQAKSWLKVLAMFQGQHAARVGIGPAGHRRKPAHGLIRLPPPRRSRKPR